MGCAKKFRCLDEDDVRWHLYYLRKTNKQLLLLFEAITMHTDVDQYESVGSGNPIFPLWDQREQDLSRYTFKIWGL